MLKTDSDAADYDKYMKLADSAYDKDRIESAKKYYTLTLEARPDDWCADLMVAACDLQQSTWEEYYGDELMNMGLTLGKYYSNSFIARQEYVSFVEVLEAK